MPLVHTKLRNRLGSEKVAKLVNVYRYLGGRKMTTLGETFEGGEKPKKIIIW